MTFRSGATVLPLPLPTASSIGQPSTATAPRLKLSSTSEARVTPDCTKPTLRGVPSGASAPVRRSSANSMIECLKQASTVRGSSPLGRPLRYSVAPRACSAASAASCCGSPAMKAGTSSAKFSGGSPARLSRSRPSLARLSTSESLPSAGQASASACSSAAASSARSGRTGKTVNRVAVTVRCRSIIGL